MKSTNIAGSRYAYKVHKQNDEVPYLLMLHGFMGDHRVYDHLIEPLCTFCNPITVDLLGHGKSATPEHPKHYREEQQISDITSLISNLNYSPLWLYGYSMGGRLALKIALTHPNLFRGLILESTTCGIPDSNNRKERRAVDAERGKAIKDDFEAFLNSWKKLKLFQSPLPTNTSLIDNYQRIQSEQSPPALAASLGGFGSGAMTPVCNELNQLDLPTLLIAGSADEKYQQINMSIVDKLPDATFSSIPAGHRVHLDNPSVLIQEIEHFVTL
ncbi:alpha/beta fold hydrolase [Fodinibius salinus]|nr:alpha/beta fold hydrolase [Fodinibius salinus]